ncbi:MAG: hypothetical protein WCK51_11045 [Armatimonadota bacterium]
MKAALPLLLVVSSVLIGTVVQAQIRVPGGVRNIAGDWHTFKNNTSVFRYDAKTGRTEQLGFGSATNAVKFKWDLVTEDKSLAPGSGPFEVIEGNNKDAMAVRIDRSTGQTWIMYGINGGVSRWEAVRVQ